MGYKGGYEDDKGNDTVDNEVYEKKRGYKEDKGYNAADEEVYKEKGLQGRRDLYRE